MSLKITNLKVAFGSFIAVNEISFQVLPGDVHFLIGANGAGKTTCIDAISGLAPGQGSVQLDGTEILGTPVHRIARMGVGRTFQTASVFEELSVLQNLDIACGIHRPLRALLGVRHRIDPRIEHALEVTGLADLVNAQAGTLSHGQKQWLEIAMLLVQDAQVLMLDEPVAGMSEEERVATGELLQRVARGRVVLVVEHDMEFMRRFATRVTVMNRGTILCEGSVDEIQANPDVQSIYLGTAGK
ncbi:urea ABC transporter ATP-binding protein UrtD [Corynebacterium glutamicum]|uniref:urea ABC transporter ATP-binding protein UrtD n=1 Tax=Corynebacterium glutamicum TaxID=1718 RepID=UPI000944F00A|nr:urea ABC transporter ATP-binding protein UrtD [Corynebacterium glutamicum]OKX86305.1 urea ABC transporter ATP-binding protein UrtD [Corynebacterium glutamicum]QDX75149.1 urea ABC transporter ATP-binding protein [Corynebacterium glutamicum]QDX77913.1 urea ABC transporter ATP-binding protein [Corynebacterium glutamicum]QYR18379.1 urea ABC transporter ATP-binding protein UrtD [Corynebacterium glutamicum]TWS35199.1 urea ABC transporter ATP-binding protein [Corynebacterium glutamicum]